jgi:hypothetical protein
MTLAEINTIWIGPELGSIHVACLNSFRRHGHKVTLHCYEPPKDLPKGIELADAELLLSKGRLFYDSKTGSPAPFTDLLRYEILGQGWGLYVDCDIYCLRPIEDADYIFGKESADSINSAILKLPKHCPALAELREIKNSCTFDPPWRKKRPGRGLRARLLGRRQPLKRLEDLRWATIGPMALTYYLKKHGLLHLASPLDRFYPLSSRQVELLFDPGVSLSEIGTSRTDAIHLHHHAFSRRGLHLNIREGSPIWEIVGESAKR